MEVVVDIPLSTALSAVCVVSKVARSVSSKPLNTSDINH
jgi:hypothetical protein